MTYYSCDDHNLDCEDNDSPEHALESLLDEDIGPDMSPEQAIRMHCPITVYRYERTECTYGVDDVLAMMRDYRPDWFEDAIDLMKGQRNGR